MNAKTPAPKDKALVSEKRFNFQVGLGLLGFHLDLNYLANNGFLLGLGFDKSHFIQKIDFHYGKRIHPESNWYYLIDAQILTLNIPIYPLLEEEDLPILGMGTSLGYEWNSQNVRQTLSGSMGLFQRGILLNLLYSIGFKL